MTDEPVMVVHYKVGEERDIKWGENGTIVIGGCKRRHRADELERLPAEPAPQPTVEVGQWWQRGDTAIRILEGPSASSGRFLCHSWHDDETDWWQSDFDGWTKCDGPPEPPVGAVYVIHGYVWQAQGDGRQHVIGSDETATWDALIREYGYDASTLRVLAVLDGEK